MPRATILETDTRRNLAIACNIAHNIAPCTGQIQVQIHIKGYMGIFMHLSPYVVKWFIKISVYIFLRVAINIQEISTYFF